MIPVGTMDRLLLVTRTPDGFRQQVIAPVRFVPMTGEAQER